jgi:NitT/TauT family transport system ATP-binding protein
MRQRVGFARALVIEPDLLLLDEPFSALDIYTSSKIRNDVLSLWENKEINTKSIILVTHNVEEAVMMSDRILVWGSNPGTIRREFTIPGAKSQRNRRNMFEKIEEISSFMQQQIAISEQYGKRDKN